MADIATIKRHQQEAWAAGDFSRFATTIVVVSEMLCEAVDLRAGQRVLDVATGSGNTAIAAARRWCEVTGIDYVPELLERARLRAEVEGLDVTFLEADAEDLPFPDDSFDVVLSTFGVMFAPNQARAAAELIRVCRPGGKVAMANFTPDSLAGGFFRAAATYARPARGVRPPILWGTEDWLRATFGDAVDELQVTRRSLMLRYRSAEHWFEFFGRYFGPIRTILDGLDDGARQRFGRDLMELVIRANRSGDATIVSPIDYAEVVMRLRDGDPNDPGARARPAE